MQNWRIHETLIKCCSVNLAFALGMLRNASSTTPRLRVGILDLDVFGPSIPTLMGLQNSMEPELTTCVFVLSYSAHRYMLCFFYNIHHLSINTFFLILFAAGAIKPLTNHGVPCMSMGFLLPQTTDHQDTPIVWRGLMVQKAVQQLLFDVDWTGGSGGPGLDVLVIDMPPGTGDVPLTLGQLVQVDGMGWPMILFVF